MDTKARVGLFVGGLVLVGMVAWILMPGSKPADKDQVAVNTDTAQNNAEPASQPATAPAGDIFAGGPAATQPVAPSTLSFGQTLPPATQPTMNTAMNAAGAAGAAGSLSGRELVADSGSFRPLAIREAYRTCLTLLPSEACDKP